MNHIPWGYIAAIFTSWAVGYAYGSLRGWNEGYTYGRMITTEMLRKSQRIGEPMDKEDYR